ncbi:MAG: hypothetical protein IRY99_17090 [Isosphaeraceae bacterium]|nr:hypothetical protein [Isosphaeraceae bacterium]
MRPLAYRCAVPALVVGLLLAASGLTPFQKEEGDAKGGQEKKPPLKTAGVIIRVEQIDPKAKEGDDSGRKARLTIQADAVWRDFVRDQASLSPDASTKKAAQKGQQSIATKPQPSVMRGLLGISPL